MSTYDERTKYNSEVVNRGDNENVVVTFAGVLLVRFITDIC